MMRYITVLLCQPTFTAAITPYKLLNLSEGNCKLIRLNEGMLDRLTAGIEYSRYYCRLRSKKNSVSGAALTSLL